MPIYAYRCTHCGHAKDVLQKMSDPLLTVCPACGESTFAKQVTAAGFQLKGSGWYVTDFRGDSKGAKPPAEGGEAAGTSDSAAAGDASTKAGDGKSADGKAGSAKAGSDEATAAKSGAEKAGAGRSGSEKPGADQGGGAAKPAPSSGAAPAAPAASAPSRSPSGSAEPGSR